MKVKYLKEVGLNLSFVEEMKFHETIRSKF